MRCLLLLAAATATVTATAQPKPDTTAPKKDFDEWGNLEFGQMDI